MPKSSPSTMQTLAGRQPPYSEEAERGVLGSLLLDAQRVVDMCVESQLVQESFYVPAHQLVYEASIALTHGASVIDILTVGEQLRTMGKLEVVGGSAFLDT
ncbi:MAG: replicative DNA helicase, partial [Kiritimatiellae bacterium]|nr:replicative DNA helicase [Kiritimatiellia bacterium]